MWVHSRKTVSGQLITTTRKDSGTKPNPTVNLMGQTRGCVCVYVTSSSHGRDGTTRSKTPQKSRASRVKTDEKEKQQVGCQGGREEILRQVMEARFARSEKVLGATSREVGLDEAKDVLEKKTRITTTNNETVDVSVSKSLSIGVEDVRIAPAGMNDEYRDLS